MDDALELVTMKSREMDAKAISETEGVKWIVRVAPHWHMPELVKPEGVIRFITSKWISGVSISRAANTEDP